jgi:2-octaprenyl-6-methoxyphenol hydroxylase
MAEQHGIVIVGGGPIGCAAAAALRCAGLDCLVLEARAADAQLSDARTLALSYGSRLILERLGAWQALPVVTPITSIHVSQRRALGRTLLQADEVGLEALGYVVRFSAAHRALLGVVQGSGGEIRNGARVTTIETAPDGVAISGACDGAEFALRARLVIVADGGVALAEKLGARFTTRDYHQSAVVGLVRSSLPHGNRAFERFTPRGPIALLPCEEEFALVWTCPPGAVSALLALSDREFLARIQSDFGHRAGQFLAVRSKAAFPLTLRYTRQSVAQRVALLGNSAQMLHPIAGQGFNLGLRDAWDLAQLIVEHAADPGHGAVLARYRAARLPDRVGGIGFTDLLTRIFSNDLPLLASARGIALGLIDVMPPAKRFLMRRMIFGAAR